MKINKKRKYRRHREPLNLTAKIGTAILIFHITICFVGPYLSPYPPDEMLTTQNFAKISKSNFLGGDYLGRDLLSRMLYGARSTIGLAVIATVVGFALGVGLGFTAAETGGWIDNAISRLVDVLISFPPILFALVVIAGLGTSIAVLVGTVAMIHVARVARVARAIAMNIAANEFVEIARARGESLWSILRREIWPNSIRQLTAEFGLRLIFSVLFLSALSFLGLGIQPPTPDWGVMVRENLSGLYYGSLASLIPAAAISSLTVGINFVVDWLIQQSGKHISEEIIK